MIQINALEEFLKIDNSTDLTKEQKELIIKSYFKFAKTQMADLEFVRFKYLGAFVIYPGRAKGMLNKKQEDFIRGKITEEELEQWKVKINNLIGRIIKNKEDDTD